MGTLYLIATPIGNLEDISARALRLLKEVNYIAAEDTRQTRKLLSHFGIHTPITSYHEHNKRSKISFVLEQLAMGDVGLVSDAGTPSLNDPGYELVRAALDAGYAVSPIPGPCAPVAALIASGLPTDAFLFLGYLPRKSSERRRTLNDIAELPYTLVFLESPHRLISSLEDLITSLGNRQAAAARELTKLHEEIFRGSLEEVRQHFSRQAPRGEFTLVIAGSQTPEEMWDELSIYRAISRGLKSGQAPSKLAGQIAAVSGWPRRQVYQIIKEIQNSGKGEE
jgi:16S rRNA (cytidine1402-2'-O)-methyltransferase